MCLQRRHVTKIFQIKKGDDISGKQTVNKKYRLCNKIKKKKAKHIQTNKRTNKNTGR
jgi:hypothetical protein